MWPAPRTLALLAPWLVGLVMLGVFWQPVRAAVTSDGLFAIVLIVYLLLLRLAAKLLAHVLSESESE